MVDFLKAYQERIERAILKDTETFGANNRLKEAASYALTVGGKRLRPALVMMVAEALNPQRDVSLASLCVEYFHTATLIADDLPCMDDDDMRRGKPSTHIVFGEDLALLASYGLIASGYYCLARNAEILGPAGDLVYRLATTCACEKIGFLGVIGGQFLDLHPPNLSWETVRETIVKKTVCLFEVAFVFGWLYGGGDPARLAELKKAAEHFGLVFQILDDFGDQAQDIENARQINVPNLLGRTQAQELLQKEMQAYAEAMKRLNLTTPGLLALERLLSQQVVTVSQSDGAVR